MAYHLSNAALQYKELADQYADKDYADAYDIIFLTAYGIGWVLDSLKRLAIRVSHSCSAVTVARYGQNRA